MREEKDFVIGIRTERQQMPKYVEAYQLGNNATGLGRAELERFNQLFDSATGAEKAAIDELWESVSASLNLDEQALTQAQLDGLI